MSDAFIVSPPLTDFTRPVPELAQLKAATKAAGVEAHTVDLNLRAFLELMSPQELRDRAAQCEARIAALVKRPVLQFWEQQELLALSQGLADGLKAAEDSGEALETLRSTDRFFHRDAYGHAVKTVNAVFNLLSGLTFPFSLSPSAIGAPFSIYSSEAIARFRPLDPFRRSYDKVKASAITVVLSEPSQFLPAFSLAAELKQTSPDSLFVLCGPWVEQWDESAKPLALEYFDAVVTMDAEQLLPELLSSHKDGKLKALPHVWYKDSVKATGRAKAHAPIDVEKLPVPDTSDLVLSDYPVPEPVLTYRPTRGRHLSPMQLNYWGLEGKGSEPRRALPPQLVAAHVLEMTEKASARFVQLVGDGVEPDWVTGLCRSFSDRKVRFTVELSLDRAVTREEAAEWKAAGCVAATVGLTEHRRAISDATHTFEALAHSGIAVQTSAVLCWPKATEDSARELVNAMRSHHQEVDAFFIGETMGDFGLRLAVPAFDGSYAMLGDGVGCFPEFSSLNDMQRDRVEADVYRLTAGYTLRRLPFAGSVGTAHTLLGFDRYGRRVFAQPPRPTHQQARPISDGDRIKLAATAKLLWIPYQLSVLGEIAAEEHDLRDRDLMHRSRDISADKTWAYSSRDDLKLRAGQRTPHVLAPHMPVTEITVGLADLLSIATEQFMPVSQLVAKAQREMRDALKRQLASLHAHGALITERESRGEQPRQPQQQQAQGQRNGGGGGGSGGGGEGGQGKRRRRRRGRGGGGGRPGAPQQQNNNFNG